MKIVTRTLTALGIMLAGLFVATPAFAEDGHVGISQYSTAGTPLDVVAISIVMVILLVGVLATATFVGNMFEKKD